MTRVALWAGSTSPPSASATSSAKAWTDGRAAHQDVAQRFGAALGILERFDRLGHVARLLSQGMDHRHGFLAAGRGRDRLGLVGVLLGVPFGQGLVVAAFARSQRSGPGLSCHWLVRVIAVVATGYHGNSQRTIGMPDDVHARAVPVPGRTHSRGVITE